ncbi:MAG: efflux RND transporter periplasmic adaptor subunit [Phaeodactylibacter sp.]|nr:efflux RND transporter periplasmic adaptor subunit [Phaeodactylibacter sp.]MCB9276552.1 efflux RND transporter periplasmic adaptor subunit [Lewinellaceae bacterium]
MDRNVSEEVKRHRTFRQAGIWLSIAALLLLALFGLRRALQANIRSSQIRTAVVERGDIENTLAATGLILPEFEESITSPATADIKSVHISEGAQVEPGSLLLSLDKEALQLDVERLSDELALRRNNIRKLRLELSKSLFDLQIRDSIKALNISSLEAELDNARRLNRVGGATQEQVEQAELNLRIARLEKRQLENELQTKQQSIQAELKESELEAQIQERSLHETERKLAQADIRSPRAGVLTWIRKEIGASVREGEPLAKVAGLSSYRMEGSIADLYAGRVQPGMAVKIRINDTLLSGLITNVRPTVVNDILTFDVRLDNPQHALLRPNLRVEAFVVTERRKDVLRVANGPAFTGESNQKLFIVDDGRAYRRNVPIGLSNFDYVELLDHVEPGERAIISDMQDYEHLKQITIK